MQQRLDLLWDCLKGVNTHLVYCVPEVFDAAVS